MEVVEPDCWVRVWLVRLLHTPVASTCSSFAPQEIYAIPTTTSHHHSYRPILPFCTSLWGHHLITYLHIVYLINARPASWPFPSSLSTVHDPLEHAIARPLCAATNSRKQNLHSFLPSTVAFAPSEGAFPLCVPSPLYLARSSPLLFANNLGDTAIPAPRKVASSFQRSILSPSRSLSLSLFLSSSSDIFILLVPSMSEAALAAAAEADDSSLSTSGDRPHDMMKEAEGTTVSNSSKTFDDGTVFEQLATSQSIAPFLPNDNSARFTPGAPQDASQSNTNKSNTKFCYRHNPDLKCKRQANEKSMEQLQKELGNLPEKQQAGVTNVWSLFALAPAKHRDLMLQGILTQCCSPQLSQIASTVRELVKVDFLSVLPTEISLRILVYLDPTSICRAAQVSRKWRQLADDEAVWHRMCEQHIDKKCKKCGVGLPSLDQEKLQGKPKIVQAKEQDPRHAHGTNEVVGTVGTPPATVMTDRTAAGGAGMKRQAPPSGPASAAKRACTNHHTAGQASNAVKEQRGRQPWKDLYKERYRIGSNWKHGRFILQHFQGHQNGVMCLVFGEKILATGSYDSTIKVWNVDTGEEIRTLHGHTNGLRCLSLQGNILVSGSMDQTVKIWDVNTGQCLHTLSNHRDAVIGVDIAFPWIASGSADHTIRLYNLKTKGEVLMEGHTDWVNSVKLDLASGTLLSASDDSTACLWDLNTRRRIRVFSEHIAAVQSVTFMPREFELEEEQDEEGSDKGVGFSSSRHTSASPGPQASSSTPNSLPARPSPPRYILTGSLDATLRLWDVRTCETVRTFFGHLEGVWAVAADTLRIVSGAHDGLTKIWDPRTGKCEKTYARHHGPVSCIGLNDRRLCTGGEDHEVWLYNFCAPNK